MNPRLLFTLLILSIASALHAEPLKYVFYFIGDGMGVGPVNAAQLFNRTALDNPEPLLMTTFPSASVSYTYSASSPVTDSAAAGTALATSTKTSNGMVGMAPDTVAVQSIASRLSELGWGIGIITSNAPDDATPASFYAHQPKRYMYYQIDCDMATSGFDFLGGAPIRALYDKNGKPTDVQKRLDLAGYKTVWGNAGLNADAGPRIVALNDAPDLDNSIGYAIDGATSGFNLAQLTQACLSHLEKYTPDCFFMMIEDGLIDHSLHANDAPTAVRQTVSFQHAIQVAYDFYQAHPEETLIVITADHDTGGLTVGNDYLPMKYNANMSMLLGVTMSKDKVTAAVMKMIADKAPWSQMHTFLADNLGFWSNVPLTGDDTAVLERLWQHCLDGMTADEETLYGNYDPFTWQVYEMLHKHAGLAFVSTFHTGGYVPVYAIGRGAERFSVIADNVDIPARIWDTIITTAQAEPGPMFRQPDQKPAK